MLYSNEQTRIKTEIYIVNRSKSIPPQISPNVLQAQSFDVEQHMAISTPKLYTQRKIQIGLFVIVILFNMIIPFSPKTV